MRFLLCSYVFLLVCCKPAAIPEPDSTAGEPLTENTAHLRDPALKPFYHGVASGDPYHNSVLLWTRVTPENRSPEISGNWEVSTDSLFNSLVLSGTFSTTASRGYTVKVIAGGLEPGTEYFYRFKAFNAYSLTGKTRTLPVTPSKIDLAVVSCSNIEFGYFNAYAAIARDDVDVVVHLGDYIYEYGPGVYGDSAVARTNIPAREIISLQDYRDRYSQYRLDKDLRAAHASHPFINIWDDHEITNNAYVDGAQNHQEDEGDYRVRKNVASQVFYEWLPVREGPTLYRKFDFGPTMDLIMLDERLAGRTVQPDSLQDPQRTARNHTLLGKKQMDWLIGELADSEATWKIIGNQVIFSYSDWGYQRFRQNMDAWDGYPRDQRILTEAIKENNVENIVFITGDTHTAWAFEATADPFEGYDRETGEGAIGVEFGVTSITSANANERYETERVKDHEAKIVNNSINPHLKYVNMRDHGYLKLSVSPKQVRAVFKVVPTLKVPTDDVAIDKVFRVSSGSTRLLEVGQ